MSLGFTFGGITTQIQSLEATLQSRVAWVDAAKGLAILLVVLTHAYSYTVTLGVESEFWTITNRVLSLLRMPLFFMLAGIFAASWIRRTWGELLRNKVMLLMWVYVVWVLIRFAFFSFVPNLVAPNEASSFLGLIVQAVWSSMPTWFLYALALFFVGAKLLRSIPVWLQLAVTGLVSAVFMADIITLPSSLWTGLFEYFVFFLAGVHGSALMRSAMDTRKGQALTVVWIPVWLTLAVSAVVWDWRNVIGVSFVIAVMALPAGMGLGFLLSWSAGLCYLGRNTMQIYLAHTLFQAGIAIWLTRFSDETLQESVWWLPIALVLVSTVASLLLATVIRKVGVKGVYDKPAWLDLAVDKSARLTRTPSEKFE